MKIIINKQQQLIGMLVSFSITVNGKSYGKLYNNSPLIIEGDWKQIDIEAKQLWLKNRLYIKEPKNIENLEISYSLSDTYFLIYGFILFSLVVLFLLYKLRVFSYMSLIVLGLLSYKLSNNKSIAINRYADE